jgi:hypothetical protein
MLTSDRVLDVVSITICAVEVAHITEINRYAVTSG